jgi:hypothetical protein
VRRRGEELQGAAVPVPDHETGCRRAERVRTTAQELGQEADDVVVVDHGGRGGGEGTRRASLRVHDVLALVHGL